MVSTIVYGHRGGLGALGSRHRARLATVAATGLVNELMVRHTQLPSVARAAATLPDSTFVLDHLGKPRVATGTQGLHEWMPLIEAVTTQPDVVLKLSDRLMFGSDWPVCEVAASFGDGDQDVRADSVMTLIVAARRVYPDGSE